MPTEVTEARHWGGTVSAGYEPVLQLFVDGIDHFGAGGGAFAAYVDGSAVVDVWAGYARADQRWQADTLATIFSSTKALTTLCVQILVDRGELDIDTRIADIWPEFGTAGKERIRVRHVLAHTSGVLSPVDPAGLLSWQGSGWNDYERIAAGLAAAKPAVTVGATFAYQAMSFGWLLGEVVRSPSGNSSLRRLPSSREPGRLRAIRRHSRDARFWPYPTAICWIT